MENIKNEYLSLSYQINTKVVKGLKALNINFDEFLLLLYFINEKKCLDIVDINDKVSLSEEEVLNAYSSLLSKGLIEVKIEKINGKVNEMISLESLYNKLILSSSKKENKKTDIYSKFEREFGRSLSPIEYETINNWINNGVREETIESALKEAVINGVSNLRYIDKIIYEWTKKGSKQVEKEENYEIFDYDWLGMDDE